MSAWNIVQYAIEIPSNSVTRFDVPITMSSPRVRTTAVATLRLHVCRALHSGSRKFAISEGRPRNVVVMIHQASLDLILSQPLVPNLVWGDISVDGVAFHVELPGTCESVPKRCDK